MDNLRHTEYALRIFSGTSCLLDLEPELARLGASRAVILTGETLSKSTLLKEVQHHAGTRFAGVSKDVVTHTPYSRVLQIIDSLKRFDADAIIALGGGSAVISARAAAIFLAEGSDLNSLCTVRLEDGGMRSPRLMKPKVPIVAVSSTPNSAHVKAGAGIFDDKILERRAMFDPKTRVQSVFLHPDILASAPQDLVISASLDTLILGIEGTLSGKGNHFSDALIRNALHLLESRLPYIKIRDDIDLRADLAMSGMMIGRGTDHAPAGATTALGHAIGANHGVANGTAKAVLLPHVMRFNGQYCSKGLAKLADFMSFPKESDPLEQAIVRCDRIFSALKLPKSLREIGLSRDSLPFIARRAMSDWFLLENPRPVQQATSLQEILEQAF